MATHSSILAWRILGTEEPGGLQSMRSSKMWLGTRTAGVTVKGRDCAFLSFLLST